jgi:hypothetical protein
LTVARFDGGNSDPGDDVIYTTNADKQLLSVQSAAGTTTYSRWDDTKDHRPLEGKDPDGSHFMLAYVGDNTVKTMDNQSSSTYDAMGRLTSQTIAHPPTTPGGPTTFTTTNFNAWDSQNRPIEGSGPDGHFKIYYSPFGSSAASLPWGDGYQEIVYDSGTANNTTYVLTGDGKLVATVTPDGEFIDWAVQLENLYYAVQAMPKHQMAISDAFAGISGQFRTVRVLWDAPAAASFDVITGKFGKAANTFEVVLADAVERMKQSYLRIVNAETINAYPNMPTNL